MKYANALIALMLSVCAGHAANVTGHKTTTTTDSPSGDVSADATQGGTDTGYAIGVDDGKGLASGLDENITITATGNFDGSTSASSYNQGATGAAFHGSSSSRLSNIGSLDSTIIATTISGLGEGAAASGKATGLHFSYASQADGAGIGAKITATADGNGTNNFAYGVFASYANLGNFTGSIDASAYMRAYGIYMYNTSTLGDISGNITAASKTNQSQGIYLTGAGVGIGNISGEIRSSAATTGDAVFISGGYMGSLESSGYLEAKGATARGMHVTGGSFGDIAGRIFAEASNGNAIGMSIENGSGGGVSSQNIRALATGSNRNATGISLSTKSGATQGATMRDISGNIYAENTTGTGTAYAVSLTSTESFMTTAGNISGLLSAVSANGSAYALQMTNASIGAITSAARFEVEAKNAAFGILISPNGEKAKAFDSIGGTFDIKSTGTGTNAYAHGIEMRNHTGGDIIANITAESNGRVKGLYILDNAEIGDVGGNISATTTGMTGSAVAVHLTSSPDSSVAANAGNILAGAVISAKSYGDSAYGLYAEGGTMGSVGAKVSAESVFAHAHGIAVSKDGYVGDILAGADISAKSENYWASGLIVSNTGNFGGTFYGRVYAETNAAALDPDGRITSAVGIHFTNKEAGTRIDHTLRLGGGAYIAARNTADGAYAFAASNAAGKLTIVGDLENQQTLIGNIGGTHGIRFTGGNFKLDNFAGKSQWQAVVLDASTKEIAERYDIVIDNDVIADVKTSLEIAGDVFRMDGHMLLTAKTLDDHLTITLEGGTGMAYSGSSLITITLDSTFEAHEYDEMHLVLGGLTVTGASMDNIELVFAHGDVVSQDLYTFDGKTIHFLGDVVVPEPAAVAAVLGAAALALAAFRRKRR